MNRLRECSEFEIKRSIQETGETFAVYFYTPLCGTCKLGEKMLSIIEEMIPHVSLCKCNLNFAPNLAQELKIESVPCLVIWSRGSMVRKEYAMRSVDYLYQLLRSLLS
jgi:thioredoxin-like negative regulator of GroEL